VKYSAWTLISPVGLPAHGQHALDEVLLDQVAGGRREPLLRFWEWQERALVLGSHQSGANEVDVAAAGALGFVLSRRLSGGGTMIGEPGGTTVTQRYDSLMCRSPGFSEPSLS